MIKFFDTAEQMQEYITKINQYADAMVQPWQKNLPENDKGFMIIEPMDAETRLIVYGELKESSFADDRAMFHQPGMKFRRMARFYSIINPEGEWDTLHVAKCLYVFDLDVLEMFRKNDWPNSAPMVARLLLLHHGVANRCPECDGTGTEATLFPLTFGCEGCFGTGVVNP